jgi:hypothetical protein
VNVGRVIDRLGGPKEVQALTGLSKGRISQWRTENHIPESWCRYLRAIRPEVFVDEAKPRRRRASVVRLARA